MEQRNGVVLNFKIKDAEHLSRELFRRQRGFRRNSAAKLYTDKRVRTAVFFGKRRLYPVAKLRIGGNAGHIDGNFLIMAPAYPPAGKGSGKLARILVQLAENDALDSAFVEGTPLGTAAVCVISAAGKLHVPAFMNMSERGVVEAAARKIGGRERTAVRFPVKVAVRGEKIDFSAVEHERRRKRIFRISFRRIGKAVDIDADFVKGNLCDALVLKNIDVRRKNLFLYGLRGEIKS